MPPHYGAKTGRRARPTMLDIAERAGVSQTTVSRILRGLPGHPGDIRRTVEAIAAELGYKPRRAWQPRLTPETMAGQLEAWLALQDPPSEDWRAGFTHALRLIRALGEVDRRRRVVRRNAD